MMLFLTNVNRKLLCGFYFRGMYWLCHWAQDKGPYEFMSSVQDLRMNKQIQKEIRFGWSLRHTTELKLRTHARPRLGREPVRTTEPWPGKSRVEAIRIHTGELASDCKLVGSRIIPICAYIWIYKYSYWSVNFYWTEVCWLTEWLTWIESLFL